MVDRATTPPLELAQVRPAEFPRLGDSHYFNAAAFTPIPERTRLALHDLQDRRAAAAPALTDDDLVQSARAARAGAARLLGAKADEIALGWNASFGINLAALSLPVEAGTAFVISDREFPANVYPWMARAGHRLDIVPADADGWPDEDRLLERLDRGDVSVFSLSSVQFASGFRSDLPKIGRFCRERGIFFVVDAIQSLGQIPLNVHEAQIDVLATGGHKWLCSPFGTGFAYVRRELIQRMEPRVVGWTGLEACASLDSLLEYRWEFRRDARRFEGGTLPFDGFAGLAESVGLLLEVGVERIEAHLLELLEPLVEWLRELPEVQILSSLDPERRSGILSFRVPNGEAVFAALAAAGVTCALREGALRISAHLYNTRSEVERLLELLGEIRSRRWS